jgi:hypothetical protein
MRPTSVAALVCAHRLGLAQMAATTMATGLSLENFDIKKPLYGVN